MSDYLRCFGVIVEQSQEKYFDYRLALANGKSVLCFYGL